MYPTPHTRTPQRAGRRDEAQAHSGVASSLCMHAFKVGLTRPELKRPARRCVARRFFAFPVSLSALRTQAARWGSGSHTCVSVRGFVCDPTVPAPWPVATALASLSLGFGASRYGSAQLSAA